MIATGQYRWKITPCSLSPKATFHHEKRLAKSTNAAMTIFVQVVFLAHAQLVVMPPPLPASFARTQLRNSRWFEPSFDLLSLCNIVHPGWFARCRGWHLWGMSRWRLCRFRADSHQDAGWFAQNSSFHTPFSHHALKPSLHLATGTK